MKKKYSYFQAKKIINSADNINYIARAVTPWHALGIEASVKYLESKYDTKLSGYVIILPHYLSGYAIDDKYFSNISANVIRIDAHNWRSFIASQITIIEFIFWSLFIKKRDGNFFIISPLSFDISFIALFTKRLGSINPNFVRVDEGVAYYMTTGKRKPFKSKNIIVQLKNYLVHYENILGDRLINKNKFIDTTMFVKKNCGQLVKNEIIYPFYRELFKKEKNYILENRNKYVIICTTAWNRLGIKDDEDLGVLVEVCKILRSFGYEILIKPHPRDSYFIEQEAKLKAKIIDSKSSSLEALLENSISKPTCIISFSSTTLVTSNLFWNLKTVCLSNLLNRNNISPVYLEEIDSFKHTFKNFTFFPDSLEDLCAFLNSLQNND